MSAEDILERFNKATSRLERLGQLFGWLLEAALGVALWAARVEWTLADHEKRLAAVEGHSDGLRLDVREIKARLHGVASQLGKVPGAVVSKMNQVNLEEE